MEKAREIDGDEEDVAEFAFDAFCGFLFVEDFSEFARLLVQLVKDAFDVVPIESDTRSFAGKLKTFKESGKRVGNTVEIGGRGG